MLKNIWKDYQDLRVANSKTFIEHKPGSMLMWTMIGAIQFGMGVYAFTKGRLEGYHEGYYDRGWEQLNK